MESKKSRIIGLLGTIIFHVLIFVIMFCFVIEHTPDKTKEWPPRDSSEILFCGEYVMLGNLEQQPYEEASENIHDDNAIEINPANDIINAGEQGEPSAPTTSEEESPMKVEDKPNAKKGPTKEELEAQEKARLEKEKQQEIKNQIKNQFAGKKKNNDNNNGKQGSPNGNSESGTTTGAPGTNLGGRTLAYWEKTSSTKSGTIVVSVTVNPQGYVISAKVSSGSGAAYADDGTRSRCQQASLRCRFSVAKNETESQRGTITWRFK